MKKLKPLPIGVQTFRDIIEGDFIYIDKTKFLYSLTTKNKGVYFLSRPRRFGKSLLISTLKEIFEGNKELFKNLWIYNSDYNWKQYPVLRFDFSAMKADNGEEFKIILNDAIRTSAENYDIPLDNSLYHLNFQKLLTKLSKQSETGKVVILVDEYDAPIIQHITDIEKAKEMREVLKNFYTIIKSMDEVIRFVFLTGVSKFSKAGVFSGLNNLRDITMISEYSSMLGLTEEEIKTNLDGYIEYFAEYEKVDKEEIVKQLRHWYNGYCFSKVSQTVYNPFSTFNALQNHDIVNYWFETGTPTFLINLIREKEFDLEEIPAEAEEISFSTYELETLDILPLLFQTGYLTIKGYNKEDRLYTLDYPNYEVKNSFLKVLLKRISKTNGKADILLMRLRKSFIKRDLNLFFESLTKLFVSIPYDIQVQQEKYYQTIFFLIFQIIGLEIEVEVRTNKGRIDAVVETDEIYIFEFKLRGTKEEALQQIKKKKYYEKYQGKNKTIHLIGVQFNPKAEEEYFEWLKEKI